ncbi:conserved hypothetical protein [Trichinella spiralis]|uniref:hypothetical protein n=1 Tax=Trichinella spiralis TaxID=6334 RepID=UPI0001EFB3E2|nr:conserved hypothetical protein [Trichinella spiralis]
MPLLRRFRNVNSLNAIDNFCKLFSATSVKSISRQKGVCGQSVEVVIEENEFYFRIFNFIDFFCTCIAILSSEKTMNTVHLVEWLVGVLWYVVVVVVDVAAMAVS